MLVPLLLALLAAPTRAACPPELDSTVSCSAEAQGADPCCIPSAGLFVFRQRFEPDNGDAGTWGIDSLEVLECDGSRATKGGKRRSHEEIGALCAASIDTDAAEGAWAQSEVGEGVEEVWERSWNTAGRFISTQCDGDAAVPRFFQALHVLHNSLPTADMLETAGIYPSSDVTYSLADVAGALKSRGGGVPMCEGETLFAIDWPLHTVGQLKAFVPAELKREPTCPSEGIIYPPAAVMPTPTTTTWDEIRRPTMRPITLSADEARRVKYDDEPVKKKLGFFGQQDRKRGFGHDKDEL